MRRTFGRLFAATFPITPASWQKESKFALEQYAGRIPDSS